VSTSFVSVMAAARDASAAQVFPAGALYVVATPIGNLADITLRALYVMDMADAVACEDTRHTQHLLHAYGIQKSSSSLIAVHQHNEAEASLGVIDRLRQGQRVAYVSDAGTPGISDPGARLVAAVQAQGLRAIPLPGASSLTTLLSAAGVVGDAAGEGGFVFAGFLSTKATERTQAIDTLAALGRAVVWLEAPHRIEATARALAHLGERTVTVGRELTKQFEEIATVAAQDLPAWFEADANRLRGEFALVLHPAAINQDTGQEGRILQLLLAELPLKSAVKIAAEITGVARNTLYDMALSLKKSAADTPERSE
jgi:16S rRNA (cytidine1402-2'-O)-methyltransferase